MELTERKKKILRAIVDNYIQTAEPVGSKVLSAMPGMTEQYEDGLNEMLARAESAEDPSRAMASFEENGTLYVVLRKKKAAPAAVALPEDEEEPVDPDEEDGGEDEEDDEEITYAADVGPEIVGSAEEVLDAGFVIDEDSPEDIMNVFGDADTDDE